jgi:hypothetical protein
VTDERNALVAADASGNAYVVGSTSESLDGNVNAGAADMFIAKYTSLSKHAWTRQLGTSAADNATAVAVDPNGDVYVAGSTSGGLDGYINAGGTDLFVVKYDAAGHQL